MCESVNKMPNELNFPCTVLGLTLKVLHHRNYLCSMQIKMVGLVNCAAVNIGVHSFFWIGVSGFLGYTGSNLSAHQQTSGSKNYGIFTQWNSTQQTERRSLYTLCNSMDGTGEHYVK